MAYQLLMRRAAMEISMEMSILLLAMIISIAMMMSIVTMISIAMMSSIEMMISIATMMTIVAMIAINCSRDGDADCDDDNAAAKITSEDDFRFVRVSLTIHAVATLRH